MIGADGPHAAGPRQAGEPGMNDIRARAIAIYDAFTHEHLDRRRMLRDMIALAGSAAAAEALLAGIAASPAAAQRVAPDDRAAGP